MAEMTLLEMTQNILSSMDSDEVNSIGDTTESRQVATIIKQKYFDIISRYDVGELEQLFQLDPSLDADKPTLMYFPSTYEDIRWIKYFDSNTLDSEQQSQFGAFAHGLDTDIVSSTDWTTTSSTSNSISTGTKTFTVDADLVVTVGQGAEASSGANAMFGTVTSYSGTTLVLEITSVIGSGTYNSWTITNAATSGVAGYKYVEVIPTDQFIDMVNRFNPADTNVGSFVLEQAGYPFTFYYKNNHQPTFCTVLSNNFVIFDMYDATFDTTLQGSKTMCMGQKIPTFELEDTFVPELDSQRFSLLLNEAKSLCFFELKQMPHQKAEQELKRQWSSVQKEQSKANKPSYFDQTPSFGRVPRTGGYASTGYGVYKWMRPT